VNHIDPLERRLRNVLPAAVVIAAAVLAMLAAACSGGSPSATGSGGSPSTVGSGSPSAVAYSACMRSNGAPSFPDPDGSGQLPKVGAPQLGISPSQLRAAQRACRHLLPNTGGSFRQQTQQCLLADDCSPALVQQILTVRRRYARCIRSHGFPTWPDPTIDSQSRPYFDVSGAGLTEAETHSSRMTSADRACERLVGIGGDVPVDLG
jgi:hypothetical protein